MNISAAKKEKSIDSFDKGSSAKKYSVDTYSTVSGVLASVYSQALLITTETGQDVIDNWCQNVRVPQKYDLSDLMEANGVVFKNEKAKDTCKRLLKKLLPNNELEFVIDNDIHLDSSARMHSYVQSTRQKPDVAVYGKNRLILVVEVHLCSSKFSFENTIRKLLLELVDIIRFYSNLCGSFRCYKGIGCMVSEFSGQAIICSQFDTTISVLTHYFNIHYNEVTDI